MSKSAVISPDTFMEPLSDTSPVPQRSMDPNQRARLFNLESTIAAGWNMFLKVANPLIEIRDSRIYSNEYKSFEEYCRSRWWWGKSYADQFIGNAAFLKSPIVDLIKDHAQEYTGLSLEKIAEIIAAAITKARAEGRPMTASDITAAAQPVSLLINVPASSDTTAIEATTAADLTPAEEGMMIRKALRCLHNFDIRGLWIDSLIAKVLGKTLIEKDDLSTVRPKTNIQPWFVDGFGILLTIFDVDEDLEFIYRQHKFDPAGFRTVDSKDLLKPIERLRFNGQMPEWYADYTDSYEQQFGESRVYTSARRNRVLDTLTKAGLLDRKPNLNPRTWIIRLRGDKIVDALKEISPIGYRNLKY